MTTRHDTLDTYRVVLYRLGMVIRVKPETLAELKALQAEIEQTVGVRPLMSEVVSRVIRDGVEVVRKRPAFAMDTAPKTKA